MSASFQKKINRQGQRHIQGLQCAVKQLWMKMCEHDDIEAGSKFVVFSNDNPYQQFYDNALTQLREARQQYTDGGYVGLKINARGR